MMMYLPVGQEQEQPQPQPQPQLSCRSCLSLSQGDSSSVGYLSTWES
jgi:hypothetical protein